MPDSPKPMNALMRALEERAKELNCLYRIEELLKDNKLTIDQVFAGIAEAIPPGWQYPDYCRARIFFDGKVYESKDFIVTPWSQSAEIRLQEQPAGKIEVFYTEEMPQANEGPFLKEERKLIDTIADRIGFFGLHHKMSGFIEEMREQRRELRHRPKPESGVILDMLKKTDRHLYSIISRKMLNHLYFKGIEEVKPLFDKLGASQDDSQSLTEVNRPTKKQALETSFSMGESIFNSAAKYMLDDEIIAFIQKWTHEEKSHFLVKSLANLNTSLPEIADAIRRYYHINPEDDTGSSVSYEIRASLIRRFLTDQLDYINITKEFCDVKDFYDLLQKMVFHSESHGKLGGKSAGLFLAKKIIQKDQRYADLLSDVRTPKTWHISSDGVLNFIYYNNLEEVIEQKYRDIEEIRQEYPHIIQAFKNSTFSPEIMNGLSRALDDFGDSPIIVRSSSLLEDRMGSAFAGKYKSLFLANQGDKEDRLNALTDAIAEVYASVFGPDPIGYRIERGLQDFHEEMGIMIQEVVGKRADKYFLPAFAGAAFSFNEFRWSSRIKREDGLIRLVPGLGTRAVDRVGDDYPILIAPGSPDLRVNLSYDEVVNYSPKYIDVINLEKNMFETKLIDELVREVGQAYPAINEVFSINEEGHLRKPIGLGIDPKKHEVVATFENLIANKPMIKQIHAILKLLRERLKNAVDIEFACDGEHLYLLQCRPQSSASAASPAIIPKDVDNSRIVFTATKHVSNGKVPDINYVVYVDPSEYSKTKSIEDLKRIGKAVGLLNKKLPKKKFILMGPGRWGSRDDIKLGVKVTYSDINNTACLIEIAKTKGGYVPDLSFGTHFFQDLVEASIRYLPLYPDEKDVIFNETFFENSDNMLARFAPDYEDLANIIKVINVPESYGGKILRLLMNAEEESAIAYITDKSTKPTYGDTGQENGTYFEEPWRKRVKIAEAFAAELDSEKYGVKKAYLFGTTYHKNAAANSDVDILLIFDGNSGMKSALEEYVFGWNMALCVSHYEATGFELRRMIDAHIKTEREVLESQYYYGLTKKGSGNSKKLKLKSAK